MNLPFILVEDNATIRDNLVSTLKEIVGAQILMVATGESEARTWLSLNKHWTVAVIDLFIKDGSGLGILKALQARLPNQYAVIFSNYATAEMRNQCLRLGADRVFDKSTEIDAFLDYLGALEPGSTRG